MSFRDILLISLIVTSLVLGSIYVYDVYKTKETSTETDTPAPVTETPAPQIALTPQQIADKVLKSTVTIIVYDYWGDITGTGSGFFVRPNWIVTHEHVVEDANSIGYKFLGSDQIHDISYIIDTDVRHDLALLQTNVTSRNFMTVSSNEVRVGEPIYVAGAPMNLEGTFSAGIVSALRKFEDGDWIQITAPISFGSSGGPVVNDKAELIGVTVAIYEAGQNLNFAVPARYVLDLGQSMVTKNQGASWNYNDGSSGTSHQSIDTCGDPIADIDGNTYKTVQIGRQCWMAENLKTSKYQDGTTIPNVTGNSQWGRLTTGAWVHYDNSSANETVYGKLYNWYAVADRRNVCPTGWYVPSDAEWTILSNFIGTDVGFKMKSTTGWVNNGNGSNASGFNGLPGGYRFPDDEFNAVGRDGYFWSSSEASSGVARNRGLGGGVRALGRGSHYKSDGFSVRCVLD